jgi:hypothetical protein
MISMKMVVFNAMKAIVTLFDCGEFIADCIFAHLLFFHSNPFLTYSNINPLHNPIIN